MKHVFIMHDIKKHHDFENHIHQVMDGMNYQIIYTHSFHETIQFVKKLTTPTRLYSVGGDGALNILVQAVIDTPHELVVIPLGTGNDFCRTLTQEKDPVILLKESLQCSAERIDVIQLNNQYYINAACFGVDSIIATHVHDTPHIPLIPQSRSYIVSILQHVFRYGFDEVVVSDGEKELYRGPMTLCTLNNAQYYGGGFHIIPQADIQDGYIDICIVDKIPKIKIPYMITLLLRHKLEHRKEVHYYKVKEAHVLSYNSCNMDGEEVKEKEYHFQIIPQSISMVLYNKR